MSVVLIGYRGSGKTTIGKRLASRLWQDFHDSDHRITKSAGISIAEIFATRGEPHFRDLEAATVSDLLKLDDVVIALGGGAILRPETQALLKSSPHRRIYLRCEPDVLLQRLSADPDTAASRPALTPAGTDSLEEINTVLTTREPIYRDVMTAELEVTHLTPEEAATYIVRLL